MKIPNSKFHPEHSGPNSRRGMTLVELIIASTILIIVFTLIMSVYTNFTSSKRKLLLSNELHAETSFLLERIAREIQNGTIDYQGYWRENLKNGAASNWVHETLLEQPDPKDDVFEGINFYGTDITGSTVRTYGLNFLKNCNNITVNSVTDNSEDTDSPEKQKNILYNYRYQFIFPGRPFSSSGNTETDIGGSKFIHLNCVNDNRNVDDSNYNVYDDEPAYGHGPRAFCEDSDTSTPAFNYSATSNSAQASKMLWDWDITDNGGIPNPNIKNNPPLLLVKKFVVPDGSNTHERTALRYKNNKIELIRFTGQDLDITPPDFIPDTWRCEKDFGCNGDYAGNYIWSQKETRTDISKNGIGTITDENLEWKDITPEKIEVISFDFILSPVKDPQKSFYEKERIQKPQIILILEAQIKKSAMGGTKGDAPKIRIQTTITPRIWDLVETDN